MSLPAAAAQVTRGIKPCRKFEGHTEYVWGAIHLPASLVVLPRLGLAGFGSAFTGFAVGLAAMVSQADYSQLALAGFSWLAGLSR
jgi:hypothetical protein